MKLSVITINYNNLSGLKKTLESIFEQTFQDFEFIIIDGGSKDGSRELISSYADKVDYWVSERDSGVYNAMNKGIARATGDYVIHMNSGDTFFDQRTLELAVPELSSGEDIICGNAFFVNNPGLVGDYVWSSPEKVSFNFFCRDTLNHQSVFIKRYLFVKVGIYLESYKSASDWLFFLRAFAFHGATYKKINQIVSQYDRTGFSTLNWQVGVREQQEIFKRDFSFYYDLTDDDLNLRRPILKNVKINLKRILKLILPYMIVRRREIKSRRIL